MRVAVVGSGPAGVAAASILLATGVEVDVYDGGRSLEYSGQRLAEVSRSYVQSGRPLPETVIQNLHWGAKRPRLGSVLSAAVNQGLASRIGNQLLAKPLFGSDFVFADVAAELPSEGSWLPMSLATGGMSNIWGAACYPLRASDYQDWPIDEETMAPWYTKAAEFLGIANSHLGQSPDYALYPPASHRELSSGCASEPLLAVWSANAEALAARGVLTGPASLAIDKNPASSCRCLECGLCLYGCPVDAIWNSSRSLSKLAKHERLRTRHRTVVASVFETANNIVLRYREQGEMKQDSYDVALLAAGALQTARIVAQSLEMYDRSFQILDSQVHVLLLRTLRHSPKLSSTIALSQGILAFEPGSIASRAAHLQLYSLHPKLLGAIGDLAMYLPAGLRSRIFTRLGAFVVGLLFLHSENSVPLRGRLVPSGQAIAKIVIESDGTPRRLPALAAIRLIRELSPDLGLTPFLRIVRTLPPGASCHIGGTVPMRKRPDWLECDAMGRIRGFKRCFAVDGSALPAVPAQNPTFTIVANAMRIAHGIRIGSVKHLLRQPPRECTL